MENRIFDHITNQNTGEYFFIIAPLIESEQVFHEFSANTTVTLPKHLDRLLDQPFDKKKSIKVDLWLWYCQQEFEGVAQ